MDDADKEVLGEWNGPRGNRKGTKIKSKSKAHMDDADKEVLREWNGPRGNRKGTKIKSKSKAHALRPHVGCNKGNAVRILLANNAHRRTDDNQSMPGMSSA
nr:hypothetical protein [Tanacetum cinerariifolium]